MLLAWRRLVDRFGNNVLRRDLYSVAGDEARAKRRISSLSGDVHCAKYVVELEVETQHFVSMPPRELARVSH